MATEGVNPEDRVSVRIVKEPTKTRCGVYDIIGREGTQRIDLNDYDEYYHLKEERVSIPSNSKFNETQWKLIFFFLLGALNVLVIGGAEILGLVNGNPWAGVIVAFICLCVWLIVWILNIGFKIWD